MTTPTSTATALPYHTDEDIRWLQACLDDSYRRAGAHLRSIHTDAARLSAADLVRRLPSMHVMVVATSAADGRPFTGPVDAFLHHGRVHFGTAVSALRARHLDVRPAVSITHVDGETLTMSVHGHARRLGLTGRDADFADRLRAHYGTEWVEGPGDGAAYYAVEPHRVLAADMSVHVSGAG